MGVVGIPVVGRLVAAIAAMAGPADAATRYRDRVARAERRAQVAARNQPRASVPGSIRRAKMRANERNRT